MSGNYSNVTTTFLLYINDLAYAYCLGKQKLCGLILRMRMFHSAVGYLEQVDKIGHNDTLRYKKVIPR